MTHRVLFLSNGHGEDSIAGTLIDHVCALGGGTIAIDGWPMVGRGDAYRSREVPLRGASNTLPSEGFATLSFAMLARDLRSGWLQTHLRQWRAARALRGHYDLLVAVGDVVPIAAAVLAKVPFVFVGCAKSDYYGPGMGYTLLERRLLRTRCRVAFPRDQRTTLALASARVNAVYVGNPMMDQTISTSASVGALPDEITIACLPGSRSNAVDNAVRILDRARAIAERDRGGRRFCFLIAAASNDMAAELARRLDGSRAPDQWSSVPASGPVQNAALWLAGPRESRAIVLAERTADVLHAASLVIGLAGTANEQAIGLGKPLVTFDAPGPQGRAFLRMKMRYFGEAAALLPDEPAAFADGVLALLADVPRQRAMAAAGRERMGEPGASAAIASAIVGLLRASGTA